MKTHPKTAATMSHKERTTEGEPVRSNNYQANTQRHNNVAPESRRRRGYVVTTLCVSWETPVV